MSGSGKSTSLRALEDIGYYCVDNLPLKLIQPFLDITAQSTGEINKLALVMDAREEDFIKEAAVILSDLRQRGYQIEVLFLDARDNTILSRFKETRRPHPLSSKGDDINAGIKKEREALLGIRKLADVVMDTTSFNPHDLKKHVQEKFKGPSETFQITLLMRSFGFRFGLPLEADMVLDVRCFPNPYFVEGLRNYTGKDAKAKKYVLNFPEVRKFLEKTEDLLRFLIPQYQNEGKSYLNIAIGCTGGKHRSVAIAEELAKRLQSDFKGIQVKHRDIDKS